jgi:hypothetical protein
MVLICVLNGKSPPIEANCNILCQLCRFDADWHFEFENSYRHSHFKEVIKLHLIGHF